MTLRVALVFLVISIAGAAQNIRQFVGTVAVLKPATAEIDIKPDSGDTVTARVSAASIAQRIAPGERDLKKAAAIQIGDIAPGDRVLVALEPGTTDLRRIIVMSSTDIAKHNDADREDWTKRGVAGVVAEKKGNQIVLKMKSLGGEKTVAVTIGEKTTFKRYAPDSIRFADAKPSAAADINIGDQLRARGRKSDDGLSVDAEDIVFGTFQTRAGSVVSVDAMANEITLKELGTGKTLTVKLKPDSQIKALPEFAGAMGGMQGRGPAPGGMPGGMPGRGMQGGPPDISQMIEHIPAATLDALKPGQSAIVSSTKGADADRLTAITLVANADMLIRMASATSNPGAGSGGGRGGASSGGPQMGGGQMGGIGMGGMGLDLSGMTP